MLLRHGPISGSVAARLPGVRVGQILDDPEAAVRREFGAERILPAEPVRPG